MARPIQNTPTIKGEDAKRFRKGLSESLTKKLTPEEKDANEGRLFYSSSWC